MKCFLVFAQADFKNIKPFLIEKGAKKASGCCIDTAPRTWERPSDHVPVVAEFEGV